ncbi:MAG TPA: MBL fold metallo-hydrolase [Spirochaetota bacterium]|nr:MBL fold metallo-hydrolase [Spirochaetota bacterium]HOS31901.1 MBL fold metallo-hydrolase [Spirochaetota bacterium]HOS54488.1 MBL fold metallo-hydrolase [Spirochaetota bacterium]HPK62188.1 MBL fold metallo-hydrolase [Spirochaetota bacterium]HQF76981.1 MBL fold metallo-hydrolase [Spirochaetota bacterium]
MQIKFHGSRGSIPAPGIDTIKYGGNTSCVEFVSDEGQRIIIDAGTGIRKINRTQFNDKILLFFSHSHWDHLQGLPFFNQIFNPDARIEILLNARYYDGIKSDLLKQMSGKSFPIQFDSLPCDIKFIKIEEKYEIDSNLYVEVFENAHPGGSSAIKIVNKNKIFTFSTDNEISIMKERKTYDNFVKFCSNSTILAHDAQYLDAEMKNKKGWGHSSIQDVCDLLIESQIQTGFFTHHDPERTDDQIDDFENIIAEKISRSGRITTLSGAREEDVIEI